MNSTGMERPHVIQEGDCYVQLPTAERSFMFEMPIKTEHLIPPPLSSNNPHPNTHSMGSEAYLVRIVALWGRVTKYINQGERLYDVNPPWAPESGFTKLNAELQEWVDRLPHWLKYSSSNLADQVAISQAPSFVFMHVAYHTIICTLHRFSVPGTNMALESEVEEIHLPSWSPPPDFLQNSVKTCFKHAKAISTIMAEVISRPDCIVTAPFLGFAMFTANLFHLHQVFTPCPYVDESPKEAREFFATGVTFLNELRIWWGPLEMLYTSICQLWRAKAYNSQVEIIDEQTTQEAATTVAPRYNDQSKQEFSGTTSTASGSSRPLWMSNQPNSPGRAEHFDTTGLIPLPGGNFGLDFIDPNLYSSAKREDFGDMVSDSGRLEAMNEDQRYKWTGDTSPETLNITVDTTLTSASADNSKGLVPPPVTPDRPLSPFSNALHRFGRPVGPSRLNPTDKSPVITKEEPPDEHKRILEQIHKDENSVMLISNLTFRGVIGSTMDASLATNSAIPMRRSGSGKVGKSSWATQSTGHAHSSPVNLYEDDYRAEDGSEEEEAVDLLFYFHARSGANESDVADNAIEVPGDEVRPNRAASGSSRSLSPVNVVHHVLQKRKHHETEEDFSANF